MNEDEKRLVIIDGNALVHRAFHALPSLSSPEGKLVNAVYGFLLVFLKALKDLQPNYVAATFDLPGPTFRDKIYKQYKAKRAKAPAQLYEQIPLIKKILIFFGVPIFEKSGFEADDIIGTISRLAEKQQISPKIEIFIVTGDLDALSLINTQTKVYTLKQGLKNTIIYDRDLVMERYNGLKPEQLIDLRGLRGDPSDNIPGVPGIGEKTAIQLLNEYGTIEELYSAIENNRAPLLPDRIQNKLRQGKDMAFFSKKLAEINFNVAIDFHLEECLSKGLNRDGLIKIFQDLGFYSLIKRLPDRKRVRLGDF